MEEKETHSSVNSHSTRAPLDGSVGVLDICSSRREVMDHGEKEEFWYPFFQTLYSLNMYAIEVLLPFVFLMFGDFLWLFFGNYSLYTV